jgi:hypothetical protein
MTVTMYVMMAMMVVILGAGVAGEDSGLGQEGPPRADPHGQVTQQLLPLPTAFLALHTRKPGAPLSDM